MHNLGLITTRSQILKILEPNKVQSGEGLAKKLKISRQALHKQIQILRKAGYLIEGKSNLGYQLLSKPDILIPEEIKNSLMTDFVGRDFFYFKGLDSTQNKVKELANQGSKEGTLVLAEKQSSGRGRLGRTWISESGGLWFSVLLRPRIPPQQVPLLSLIASLAIAKGIEASTSISCALKWPNDILIETEPQQYKKLCGILVEMASESDRVNWVVIGCGVNVNNEIPSSLVDKATSLKSASGTFINRTLLLSSILTELENNYEKFLREGFVPFRKEYLDRFILLGKKVLLTNFEQDIEGECVTIDPEGHLILLTRDQKTEKFSAGEVSLSI